MPGGEPFRSNCRLAWWVSVALATMVVIAPLAAQPPLTGPDATGPLPGSVESIPAPAAEPTSQQVVLDVRVKGNVNVTREKVLSYLRTRKGRVFDAEVVQADKRRLATTGLFRDVRIYTDPSPQGVVVTFEVFERPTIAYIRFIGNRGASDKVLLKECRLKEGEALNVYSIEEARRRIIDLYHRRGYPKAHVEILEGTEPGDRGIVFDIAEGPLQRIAAVKFEGNTIASDARLKTKIQSKPGFLVYLFGGKVDESKIDEDVERLTAYYRSLGFFRARIGRRLEYDEDGNWLTLHFIIDEGPRYVVRNVTVEGNERFPTDALLGQLQLKMGEYFQQDKMNADVNALRDIYGGQGFIFADIRADPRFLEEPGQLDLVYSITEGEQFRVGRINVHIAGEFPHTRETVVLDRLSFRPGDIVDIREIRASERRLKASQLFTINPAEGNPPRIVIRPPDLTETQGLAEGRTPTVRGQSPEASSNTLPDRRVDLDVYVTPGTNDSAGLLSDERDQQP